MAMDISRVNVYSFGFFFRKIKAVKDGKVSALGAGNQNTHNIMRPAGTSCGSLRTMATV